MTPSEVRIGRQDAVKVVEADPGGVAGDAPVGERDVEAAEDRSELPQQEPRGTPAVAGRARPIPRRAADVRSAG